MNTDESKNDESIYRNKPGKGAWAGLIVLIIGCALLLNKTGFFILPPWTFSWQMLLIALGVIIGVKTGFRGIGWLIMILIGTFFLLDDLSIFSWHLYELGLPLGIIIVGLFLIFRSIIVPSQRSWFGGDDRRYWTGDKPADGDSEKNATMGGGEDFIDVVTVFGSINRRIFSKKFKGGEMANFFGGTEIDLTQADIQGTVVLEIVQMFGGVKLIVPANWAIKSDMVAILGGVSDKRSNTPVNAGAEGKTLVINGVCIFSGIEIKSY